MNEVYGFTGTREGMTGRQQDTLHLLINQEQPSRFHHGDCMGADEEAHDIALNNEVPIEIHPPESDKQQACCVEGTVHTPKPYLERNRDIVDACDVLVACPRQDREPEAQRAGGTWYTVRYARRLNKNILIIWPCGHITEEKDGKIMDPSLSWRLRPEELNS